MFFIAAVRPVSPYWRITPPPLPPQKSPLQTGPRNSLEVGAGWGWGGQLARSKLLNEAEREERLKNGSPNSLSGASPPVVSNGLHLELVLAPPSRPLVLPAAATQDVQPPPGLLPVLHLPPWFLLSISCL